VKFWTSLPGLSRWPPASFSVPGANWQEHLAAADFQRIAADADRLGFDAISVPEHVVLPRELAGQMGGRWPDALTVMAFIAGATTRIRVNSGVIILPLHNPVRLAKAVATLDVLSGGRVMVTFGAGMAPGEFRALGVDFSLRGRMMDEYIRAMKVLWTADEPEFHGEFVTPRLTSTQQVVDLIADLDAAGVTWTTVPPLGDGPRSLAEHGEYLHWAATEVLPAFRRSAA
jgi:alkanesulfonate monooxygenase SsuD/methylene tetrahydromethanopterin reductase-like flavin-dependent oxidoreductase (luciferase family)